MSEIFYHISQEKCGNPVFYLFSHAIHSLSSSDPFVLSAASAAEKLQNECAAAVEAARVANQVRGDG